MACLLPSFYARAGEPSYLTLATARTARGGLLPENCPGAVNLGGSRACRVSTSPCLATRLAPIGFGFHAASKKIRRELYEGYKHFFAAFQDAAARLRAEEADVLFPPGSFPPAAPWVAG